MGHKLSVMNKKKRRERMSEGRRGREKKGEIERERVERRRDERRNECLIYACSRAQDGPFVNVISMLITNSLSCGEKLPVQKHLSASSCEITFLNVSEKADHQMATELQSGVISGSQDDARDNLPRTLQSLWHTLFKG